MITPGMVQPHFDPEVMGTTWGQPVPGMPIPAGAVQPWQPPPPPPPPPPAQPGNPLQPVMDLNYDAWPTFYPHYGPPASPVPQVAAPPDSRFCRPAGAGAFGPSGGQVWTKSAPGGPMVSGPNGTMISPNPTLPTGAKGRPQAGGEVIGGANGANGGALINGASQAPAKSNTGRNLIIAGGLIAVAYMVLGQGG
jgi:hypothetical protein